MPPSAIFTEHNNGDSPRKQRDLNLGNSRTAISHCLSPDAANRYKILNNHSNLQGPFYNSFKKNVIERKTDFSRLQEIPMISEVAPIFGRRSNSMLVSGEDQSNKLNGYKEKESKGFEWKMRKLKEYQAG